jgi:hypothetical protein
VNVSYTLGKQWIKVDAAGMLYDTDVGDRVTLTDNRIRGAVHTAIAKQTKTRRHGSASRRTRPTRRSSARGCARSSSSITGGSCRPGASCTRRSGTGRRAGPGSGRSRGTRTKGEKTTVLARPNGGPVLTDAAGRPMKPRWRRASRRRCSGGHRGAPDRARRRPARPQDAVGDVPGRARHRGGPGLLRAHRRGGDLRQGGLQRRYPKVDFDQIEATANPSAGIMESRFPGASSLMRDSERGGRTAAASRSASCGAATSTASGSPTASRSSRRPTRTRSCPT